MMTHRCYTRLLFLLVYFSIFSCANADSLNVRRIGQFSIEPILFWEVKVSGYYAYTVGSNLSVIDIRRSDSLSRIGFYRIGDANALEIVGHYAYVACYFGLTTFNITRPDSLFIVSDYPLGHDSIGYPGLAYDITINNNYAYIADGDSGLIIVNITNPASPRQVGFCRLPGMSLKVIISGSYAYVTHYDSCFSVIDISNPASPRAIARYVHNGYGASYGVGISGNYLFVAFYNDALRIFNISNPASPHEVGNFPIHDALTVTVSGDYAFVGGDSRYYIFNISNPASVRITGYYDTQDQVYETSLIGNTAYVANNFFLSIFDCSQALSLSDPSANSLPTHFTLAEPYPNPFNASTFIKFELPQTTFAKVQVFDAMGRLVNTLANENLSAGRHQLQWNATATASGQYFVRLSVPNYSETRKVVLMR